MVSKTKYEDKMAPNKMAERHESPLHTTEWKKYFYLKTTN
jgi:hypothetical protein